MSHSAQLTEGSSKNSILSRAEPFLCIIVFKLRLISIMRFPPMMLIRLLLVAVDTERNALSSPLFSSILLCMGCNI